MGIGMVFLRITSNRALWRVHMHGIAGVAVRGSCRRAEGVAESRAITRTGHSHSQLAQVSILLVLFAYLCNE